MIEIAWQFVTGANVSIELVEVDEEGTPGLILGLFIVKILFIWHRLED